MKLKKMSQPDTFFYQAQKTTDIFVYIVYNINVLEKKHIVKILIFLLDFDNKRVIIYTEEFVFHTSLWEIM